MRWPLPKPVRVASLTIEHRQLMETSHRRQRLGKAVGSGPLRTMRTALRGFVADLKFLHFLLEMGIVVSQDIFHLGTSSAPPSENSDLHLIIIGITRSGIEKGFEVDPATNLRFKNR